MEVKIQESHVVNIHEIIRALYFVSEDIQHVEHAGDKLTIDLKRDANYEHIQKNIQFILKTFVQQGDIVINQFTNSIPYSQEHKPAAHRYVSGRVIFNSDAVKLFNFFDSAFKDIALELNAQERIYPTLLPISVLKKTNYLKTSPQYSMFVCYSKEDFDVLNQLNESVNKGDVLESCNEPQFSLSPAACFHTYEEYENKTLPRNQVLTFTQNVFRNEGRKSWEETGRLRDYKVREIVFIGDSQFVFECKSFLTQKTIEFVKKIGLRGYLCTSHDSFIIPNMQKYKKFQWMENTKQEIKLESGIEKQIAVASFNFHSQGFTHPFNIKINNIDDPVSGCVGFGLERWVISFLHQFGHNPDLWPAFVSQSIIRQ
ncbi:hypothetical protein KDC22_11645 [Paenibacillus tritici]|uniref:hypothetical protein n=1 Tax=Paenibacillus tritici TaxID=1873425 RepID=UPI001BA5C718|nr:hypothetical protein [Paenibacillus tritici]QUL57062.1 hypothetical protein KDC22_11645 [Paenibacillus tritici]